MKLIIFMIALHATLIAVNPFEGTLKVVPEWITEQIEEDFRGIAPSDLSDDVLEQVMQQNFLWDPWLVYYKIQAGKLYFIAATPGALTNFEKPSADLSFTDMVIGYRFSKFTYCLKELTELCKKYALPLPDCKFLICLRDEPNINVSVPHLCFSKKIGYPKAVLVPDPDCLYHETLLTLQVDVGCKKYPWSKKVNQAFWRGRSTGSYYINPDNYSQLPRFCLVQESLKHPDFVDAKFSELVNGAEKMADILSPYLGKEKSISTHLRYKYQILVDGNTCSWSRAYWQLFSNSVIFKQDSDFIQWYYKAIHPYEHYIPVAADFHDLVDQITWVRVDDPFALQVSQNANRFAKENLSHLDMLYYIYLVLCKYSEVQQAI